MTNEQNIALGYAMGSLCTLSAADRLIVSERLVDWARDYFDDAATLDDWERYQDVLDARRKEVRDVR